MRILFISHDASRTGAPLLLLNFLKWLKKNPFYRFDILLLNGGELEKEFKSISDVYHWNNREGATDIISRIKYKLMRIFRIPQNNKIEILLRKNKYDTIYGNTVVSSTVIKQMIRFFPKASIILHIHELQSITNQYSAVLDSLKKYEIQYIAASQITKNNLIAHHNISADMIKVIYEYIDVDEIRLNKKEIPSQRNTFTITGSGFVQARKGYDIFIMIAKRAIQKYPEIPFYFQWIGDIPPHIKPYIDIDIKEAGLTGIVKFLGKIDNPFTVFALSDLFIMTSREDPFPTVCLEHAALGIPILCFSNVSGIPEFIENDAGEVVPYLDIETMVDALKMLYQDDEKYTRYSNIISNKVKEYDIKLQAPKLLSVINNA